MKLCYRGVRYDYTPNEMESTEGDVIGQYRGAPLRAHIVKPSAKRGLGLLDLAASLTYRGAHYKAHA